MLTALGKELRKLRIDRGVNMLQMATALGMSSAMLSAVETGRKKTPGDFIDRLVRGYPELEAEMERYVALVNLANREVRVSLEEASESDAELVTELARRFSDLTDNQKEGLRNLLKRR